MTIFCCYWEILYICVGLYNNRIKTVLDMDKKVFYEELKRTQKQLFSCDDDDLIYVLSFIRHMKENHVLGDFRKIWKNNGKGEIYNIFDIFKKTSLYNPYMSGFWMTEWGLRLHGDVKFYYTLSDKLQADYQRYKKINTDK